MTSNNTHTSLNGSLSAITGKFNQLYGRILDSAIDDHALGFSRDQIPCLINMNGDWLWLPADLLKFLWHTLVPNNPLPVPHFLAETPHYIWTRDRLQSGDTVLDCGANIGIFTTMMAERVGPEGQVHSFEPDPVICEDLKRVLHVNALKWVTVNQRALSNTEGEALFCKVTELDVRRESSHLSVTGYFPEKNNTHEFSVPTTTIDAYVEKSGISPKLIKIDVEGAEFLVLEGGQRCIARHRPLLVIETHADNSGIFDHSRLKQFFQQNGYANSYDGDKTYYGEYNPHAVNSTSMSDNSLGKFNDTFVKALELSPDNQEANQALHNFLNQSNQRTPSKGVAMRQDVLFQQLKNSALITLCDMYSLCLRAYTGKSTLKTAIIGHDNGLLSNTEPFSDFGIHIDAFFEGIPGDIYHPSRPLEEIIGKSFDLILFGTGKDEEDMRLLSKLIQIGEQRGFVETPIFWPSRINSTAMAALGRLNEFPTCLNFRKLAMITLGVSLTASAGCIIECGSFMGGTALYIASLLREQQDDRHLYAIDTFEGMPAPVAQDGNTIYQAGLFTETSFEKVNNMIQRHEVSDRVTLMKGLVQDRLPDIWRNEDQVSFALVDTDQYSGTKASLLEIVPRLACNGIIVVDDYSGGIQEAVKEVMAQFPTLRGALNTCNFYILYKETDFRFLSSWKT